MNISTSECSSGCESGWTMYLDQSSVGVVDEDFRRKGTNLEEKEVGQDEDLSMVSDASSGPRNFHEDEDCFYDNGYFHNVGSAALENINKSKQKKKIKENSYLDDTASSPVLSFAKKNMGFYNNEASKEYGTQGFSATHFKGKSALQNHFGFLNPSAASGKAASGKSGDLQGRKWQ